MAEIPDYLLAPCGGGPGFHSAAWPAFRRLRDRELRPRRMTENANLIPTSICYTSSQLGSQVLPMPDGLASPATTP
jgi:hypothetical protein